MTYRPSSQTLGLPAGIGLTSVLIALLPSITGCQAPKDDRALRATGRIVVLGDSLAVSPSEPLGFPAVLEERLRARGLSWSVVNAGVRGDTTAGGLLRINRLLSSNRPDILVLALGANDGLRKVDANQISHNLGQLVSRAEAAGAEVLLCGMELPPLNVFSYGKEFRRVFESAASEHDVAFVPFLLEGVAMNPALNESDSIHPNADGARRIAETIWPFLEEMIRQ